MEKSIVDNGFNKRKAEQVQSVVSAMVGLTVTSELLPEPVMDVGFDGITGDYISRPHVIH